MPHDDTGAASPEPQRTPDQEIQALRSELRRLEELQALLRRKESRLCQAEAAAQLGHWDLDLVDGQLTWSDEIYRIFELDPYTFEPSYEAFLERVHPDDRERVDEAYSTSVETRRPYDLVHRLLLPDGSIKHVHERCTTTYDASGLPLRSFGIVQDITQRLRIEDELTRRQRLDTLSRQTGGLAHDFNNILVAVLGNIHLAYQGLAPGHPVRELLARAERAGLRARGLTRQMMGFSTVSAPKRCATDLAVLVRETADFALAGSATALTLDLPAELHAVEVDPAMIAHLVHNLVVNARDAMDAGGRIRLVARDLRGSEVARRLPEGPYVELRVEDEGPGIAAEDLERIFEPFHSTKPDGHGLGLAVCRSIARDHSGLLDASSTPGEGSVFRLLLPALEERAAEPSAPPERSPADHRHVHVLILDDEVEVRRVAERLLESGGHRVAGAADGDEALERVRAAREAGDPIDLAILDLTVPGCSDGIGTLARLQELAPGLPAVVTSGYGNHAAMDAPDSYGFRAALAKPFRREELLAAVERALWEPDGRLRPTG